MSWKNFINTVPPAKEKQQQQQKLKQNNNKNPQTSNQTHNSNVFLCAFVRWNPCLIEDKSYFVLSHREKTQGLENPMCPWGSRSSITAIHHAWIHVRRMICVSTLTYFEDTFLTWSSCELSSAWGVRNNLSCSYLFYQCVIYISACFIFSDICRNLPACCVWLLFSLFWPCCFWVFKPGKQESWLLAYWVVDLSGKEMEGL